MGRFHHPGPDRQRSHRARIPWAKCHAGVIESHPHAGSNLRRVAHEPGVREIIRSAGFASGWPRESPARPRRHTRTGVDHRLQHVGHDVRRAGPQHLAAFRHVFLQDVAEAVHHAQDGDRLGVDAVVVQRRVGRRDFQRDHLARTQGNGVHSGEIRGDPQFVSVVDHNLRPHHLLHQTRCHQVQASPQTLTERRGPALRAIVVVRRPARAVRHEQHDRLIQQLVRGHVAVVHSGRVHERLERRARLPFGLRCPVELGLAEIPPANHGQDVTVGGVQGHYRRLHGSFFRQHGIQPGCVGERLSVGSVPQVFLGHQLFPLAGADQPFVHFSLHPGQLPPGGLFGCRLNTRVQRGVHGQAVFVDRLAVLVLKFLAHVLGEVRRDAQRLAVLRFGQHNGFGPCLLVLLFGDVADLPHPVEDQIPAPLGPVRVTNRRQGFGPLKKAGQESALVE